MLSGKRFKFHRSITGIQLVNGTCSVITIPEEATITVLSGPDANGKVKDKGSVYVSWEDHTVAVFAVDVEARATEIESESRNDTANA